MRTLRRSKLKSKKLLRVLAVLLILLSLALVVWSLWPHKILRKVLQFSDQNLAQVGFTPAQQAALEEYHLAQISLEWPDSLRIGETGRITLTIRPQAGALSAGSSQQLVIDARLDLAGVELYPSAEVRTALPFGKLLGLLWQVRAAQGGDYAGNAWLYIVFPAADSTQSTADVALPLSAQDLGIKIISLAGMDVVQTRLLAVAGIITGILIMLIVVIKS